MSRSSVDPPKAILVVDDDPGIAGLIQRALVAAGHRVTEIVGSPADVERALRSARPDLVLMDIHLGDGVSGIDVAACVPEGIPVLFVSAHADRATLAKATTRAPAGFVVKPFDPAQLVAAVEMALAPRPSASARAPALLPDVPGMSALSDREREVLDHLVRHHRTAAIAKSLFISRHTVRNHLKNIFSKLGVSSQQELLDLLTGDRPR